MTVERMVLAFAGFAILLSVALGASGSPLFVSKYWLWFTAFVGANLFQAAFTSFCPLAKILKALGKKTGPAFD